jgi:hypothetical protein
MEVSGMKTQPAEQLRPATGLTNPVPPDIREGLQNLLDKEVRAMVVEEIKKGTQELLEEQRKVIKKSTEENKIVIQKIEAEETKAVWDNLDVLRKSIVKISF